MRYHAVAADYDGTLARHGHIDEPTWAALGRLRDSGRKLILVTGRELDELLGIIQHPERFDRIVAENGALIYEPATREIRETSEQRPPPRFIEELEQRGVMPVAVGRVIIATWEPHEDTVLSTIRDLGLELQVIFNKKAVMILPPGVNKASGLAAALLELGLSAHNVVAIGDAENDHAMFNACECGAAVANAIDALKERADIVLTRDHGAGVRELIDRLITNDLADAVPRRLLHFGKSERGDVLLDPYAANILVCGTSGSGKSTLATGLLERLSKAHYQYAIIDPEGDFATHEHAVVLGAQNRTPLLDEILDVLKYSSDHSEGRGAAFHAGAINNVVVNLLGVGVEHRPEFFAQLLPAFADLRARTGRPHWLVVDEAHHLLPASWEPVAVLPMRPHGTLYITVHPGSVAPVVLETINTLITCGEQPDEAIRDFCAARRITPPELAGEYKLRPGQALYWKVGTPGVEVVEVEPTKAKRTRHSRKYIEGNLGRERSFYFRGADGKLNLSAHNLQLFLHLGDGVDDETWLYHLRGGHYSQWLRTQVKDDELAADVERVERDSAMEVAASRAAVRAAVEKRYTLPADKPSGIIDPPAEAPRAAAARK